MAGSAWVCCASTSIKRTDPAFSPKTYGHSGLLDMIRTYDLLALRQEPGGHWTVGLA